MGPDPDSGKIKVYLAHFTEAARQLLAERYGSAIVVGLSHGSGAHHHSTDKATGTFTARHPGHATLFTTALCWVVARSEQTHGKCPALDITVLP
jgi:hypothetical protein